MGGGGGGGGGGVFMGHRAAERPYHMAVNDRDMSLLGLHLSRKKDVHFPLTSLRSIPLLGSSLQYNVGFS